jgi:hypothetical protein
MDAMTKFSAADRDSPRVERSEAVKPFDRRRAGFWNDWNV